MEFDSVESFATAAFQAVQSGNWGMLAAVGVVGLVYAARGLLGDKFPALKTDRGGAVLSLVAGVAGALGNAFLAGAPFTVALLIKGFSVAFMASGGWSLAKKLLFGDAAKVKAEAKAEGAKAAAVLVPLSPLELIKSPPKDGGK